jgi:Sulfotransferase family
LGLEDVDGIGQRLVFVCGLHRSGTSVVHRCLREHPEISGFTHTGVLQDEGQYLQTVYPTGQAHGGPGRFGFDSKAHLTEDSPLVTEANRRTLVTEWSRYWDMSSPRLVEKSPPNLIRTRFLRALFPGARFVVVMRHPIAVAGATQKWSKTPLTSLVHHWAVCHETMRADVAGFDDVIELRYEDFVLDPDAAMARIHQLIGVPHVPTTEPVRADINARYYASWRARRRYDPVGIDRRIAERRFEARTRPFGYSLTDPEWQP